MPSAQDHKSQIVEVLTARYADIVCSVMPAQYSAEQHSNNKLTRSLAAFAVEKVCDVDVAAAAGSIVDGMNDNGIDAYYFDQDKSTLWLFQSKLNNAPDMGENKKFCDGIRDLINRRFDRFSWMDDDVTALIETALDTPALSIRGVHVHLGLQNIAQHAVDDLSILTQELNQFNDRFSWEEIGIERAHVFLRNEHILQSVDVSLKLKYWHGFSDHPNKTFYGMVSAKDLANLYAVHGKSIFEKNIRHYMGGKSVNLSISNTTYENPSNLFYLNNGITAICSRVDLAGGHTNQEATFHLQGFSIVNGAQTVGSVAESKRQYGEVSEDARLLITLIELRDENEQFGAHITRARNTQNEVKSLFFVALDPEQERLKREMQISGVSYHYRPSADIRPDEITVEKSTLALAALSGRTDIIVAAKKEIGQLFDQGGRYYSALYRRDLSGVKLARLTRIYDVATNILLRSEMGEQSSNRRLFYRHGKYFILHIFARTNRALLDAPSVNLSAQEKTEISRDILERAELIFGTAENMFNGQKGYLSVFRNIGDAAPLAERVMFRLNDLDAERAATDTAGVESANI